MDKIWLDHYGPGVPHTIDADHYPSLNEIFEESFRRFADQPAFINMGETLSYRRVDELSRAFAAYLQQDLHLQRGDRVAVMMPNLLQYPIVVMGILRAGMVVVNVNPLYTPRELRHQLRDSGAKAIVIISNFAHTLEKVVNDTEVRHVILTRLGDQLKAPKRALVNFVVKYIKKLVPKYYLPGARSLSSALARGKQLQYLKPQLAGSDLAFLQYTGGTTGVAKGAMLTHRNMVANLEQVLAVIRPVMTDGKEMVVTPLPLYHIFALTANLLTFMRIGAANLLITNPRDLPAFVSELKKYRFSGLTGVNTLFNALLNTPGFDQLDFSGMKLSLGGGMAVQAAVAERWQKVTGKPLLEGYGLTECAPLVAVTSLTATGFSGTIGYPAPSTEVRLVNDAGEDMPLGEPGELLVKGPQVMAGYWQRPEATTEVLRDGWFYTGDIAVANADGSLKIVDRKKDMILVSGFNVYPNEVEDVAMMHPKVLECAALGIPNGATGEAVKLFVVVKDRGLTDEELIRHCRKHLTAYKVPKVVEFRDQLPKSNVGKILRRELREETAK